MKDDLGVVQDIIEGSKHGKGGILAAISHGGGFAHFIQTLMNSKKQQHEPLNGQSVQSVKGAKVANALTNPNKNLISKRARQGGPKGRAAVHAAVHAAAKQAVAAAILHAGKHKQHVYRNKNWKPDNDEAEWNINPMGGNNYQDNEDLDNY